MNTRLDFRSRPRYAQLPGNGLVGPSRPPTTLVIVALTRRGEGKDKVPVPLADPDASDAFLSDSKSGLCRDAAGYRRRRHDFAVWTRAGWRCLFCSRYMHEVGR
jgi:hypothetical protein